MKTLAKFALAAALLSGAMFALSAPAAARVFVGIGVGDYAGPAYDYDDAYCDPDSRWYDPYRCAQYDYWYDPIFIDGVWVHGPFRFRWENGHRVFWYRHGWRSFDGGHDPHDHGGHDWHDRDGDWHDRGGDWRDHGGDRHHHGGDWNDGGGHGDYGSHGHGDLGGHRGHWHN